MTGHDLDTARLRLRPIALEDVTAFHALCVEPSVRRFLFDDRSVSQTEVCGFVDASIENFKQHGWGLWRADLRDAHAGEGLDGFAGFLRSNEGLPDLIYAMHPARRGAGHATEAARAVLDHASGAGRAARILASVDEPNVASVRVLEKLGMCLARREPCTAGVLLYFELERPSS